MDLKGELVLILEELEGIPERLARLGKPEDLPGEAHEKGRLASMLARAEGHITQGHAFVAVILDRLEQMGDE